MEIFVNNKKTNLNENSTIEDLLNSLKLPAYYVVELNKQIIYKENYNTVLKNADKVEIASFTGGG
jgi:thiamine biosynthesis protein ThiS